MLVGGVTTSLSLSTEALVFLYVTSVWVGWETAGMWMLLLGHTGAVDAGRAHLCEYLVQPLQRAIEMQLYPAGGAGHRLTPGGQGERGITIEVLFIRHHDYQMQTTHNLFIHFFLINKSIYSLLHL